VCVLYGNREVPSLLRGLAADPHVAAVAVDNSGDLQLDAEATSLHVVQPGRNLGYPAAVNLGLRSLPPGREVVVLLNPDVDGDTSAVLELAAVVARREHPTLAAPASSTGMYGLQHHPTVMTALVTYGLRRHRPRTPGSDGYLSGAILLMNRPALDRLAVDNRLLEEDLFFMDDVELTDRARRLGVVVDELPFVDPVTHAGGETMRRRPAVRVYFGRVSLVRYWRRRSALEGAVLTVFFVVESSIGMAVAFLRRQHRHPARGASTFDGLRWTVAWLLTQRSTIDQRVLG
jgi:GT2 family glycosyltransferase